VTRIQVHCSRYISPGYADWQARCNCGEGIGTGDWQASMEWACGHLAFTHAEASA
jgi:hypothetical protein